MDCEIESTAASLTIELTAGEAQLLFDGLDLAHGEWDLTQIAMMQVI